MNEIKNQPEALQYATRLNKMRGGLFSDAASELRRLHAENQDLRTRHYCNTAEIESLQARVQELGEMARENRSKRVVELERRIAEMESEAAHNARILGASAETELALRGRIAEMEEQMAAIGAGGVEPLRKQASTAHPAEGVPAQTTRDAVIQHLTNAGVLEHDGCGIFIASGDASELIDACMALSTHAHHEKGAAAQAVQAAEPETREALAKRLIADVQVADTIATSACQRVAELPDRDSPADGPESMLVTGDELHMIVREAVIEAQSAPAYPAEGVPAQKVHPFGWFITKSKLSGDTEFTQDPVRENLAQSFGYQTKALYTHPTQQGMDAATLDALQEAESVLNSINMGKQHRVVQADGEVTYWQREEWCKWAAGEVLPKVTAAIAAQAKQGEKA